jgi:Holliday junction DNA helicase RuvA
MIEFVRGTLVEKHPTHVVIDCHGVGYRLNIPLSSYARTGEPGEEVRFLTHHHVREDAEDLYGFATADERELFILLLGVSGIGPKLAQAVLSGMPAAALKMALQRGDHAVLTRIPGVGRKTAERMVVELKDKVVRLAEGDVGPGVAGSDEAVMALVALGFNRFEAQRAVSTIRQTSHDLPLEDVVRAALQSVR